MRANNSKAFATVKNIKKDEFCHFQLPEVAHAKWKYIVEDIERVRIENEKLKRRLSVLESLNLCLEESFHQIQQKYVNLLSEYTGGT